MYCTEGRGIYTCNYHFHDNYLTAEEDRHWHWVRRVPYSIYSTTYIVTQPYLWLFFFFFLFSLFPIIFFFNALFFPVAPSGFTNMTTHRNRLISIVDYIYYTYTLVHCFSIYLAGIYTLYRDFEHECLYILLSFGNESTSWLYIHNISRYCGRESSDNETVTE